MNHHASASKRSLLAACAWWAQPSVVLPSDEPGPAAEHGTLVHHLVHLGLTSREPWPDATERAQAQATRVLRWVHDHAPRPIMSEVAMVYDAAAGTVREITGRGHRDYGPIAPSELPGSADLIWLDAAQGAAVVLDIKTGADVPPASESGQLAALGLMAAALYGVTRAQVGHLIVDDDGVREDWHTMLAEDLSRAGTYLADHLADVDAEPVPVPGPHCRAMWCPARTICPATTAAMVALPTAALDTPEDVARVWAQLGPIEDALAAVKSKVKAFLEERGAVTMADGGTLRIVEVAGRETVSIKDIPSDMAEVLRDVGAIKRGAPSKYPRASKGRAA